MNELVLLQNYQLIAALLFGIGLVGFLVRRNMIIMFLCAELMLHGVSLSLVALGRYHTDWGGQMLVIFIIAVAACEAGIALALILMLYHQRHTLDVAIWQNLREDNQPPFVDAEVPEEMDDEQLWPQLTPAGHEREQSERDKYHRTNV